VAEDLLALAGGGVREGGRDQFVGGGEVVADQAGEHAELGRDALGGHPVEALGDRDRGGGLDDLGQPLAGGLATGGRLGS